MAQTRYKWEQIGTVLSERDVIVSIDRYHDEFGWHRDGPYLHVARETVLVSPPHEGYGLPVAVPHYNVKRLATKSEMQELEQIPNTAYSYGD